MYLDLNNTTRQEQILNIKNKLTTVSGRSSKNKSITKRKEEGLS